MLLSYLFIISGVVGLSTIGIGYIFSNKEANPSIVNNLNQYLNSIYVKTDDDKRISAKIINYTLLEDSLTFIISIPIGKSIKDIKIDVIKSIIDRYYDINIENGGRNICIISCKRKRELAQFIPYISDDKKLNANNGIIIPLGRDTEDREVILDLKANPHTYIVGTTNSGKSVCLKSILCYLIQHYNYKQLELVLCDLKYCEMNLFRNVKHCSKFVCDVSDVNNVLDDLLKECKNRFQLFMNKNVVNIFDYNKLKDTEPLKYKVVVIEELSILLIDKKKKAMNILKQLISISRACGIYLLLTAQRPSVDIIDSVVKANVNNRIVFKCEDIKNSLIALDTEDAVNLKGKGHGILKVGAELTEMRSYYIDDETVKSICDKYKKSYTVKTYNINGDVISHKDKEDTAPKTININNDIDLSFLDRL